MMTTVEPNVRQICAFWFGTEPRQQHKFVDQWWKKDPAFDERIRQDYQQIWQKAADGALGHWLTSAYSTLAYIVLLDQFSRNMYRDTPQAFSQDSRALMASKRGIQQQFDTTLTPLERSIFYMPFMHSESIADQHKSIALYQQLLADTPDDLKPIIQANVDFAIKHFDIIKQFDRYPHRNAILGRKSTAAEVTFLQQPGSSF